MATRTLSLIAAALGGALAIWIWGLVAILFLLRWGAIERPRLSPRELFPYGELRVGVDASFPPFAVATDRDLFGLDIDLAQSIGERLKIPVRFVNLGYDGLYDALKVDKVDVLVSALPIDFTRSNEALYTVPYFNAGLVLVADRGSLIQHMDDLVDRSLSFEFGSEADQVSRAWLRRIAPFQTLAYETTEFALDAVRVGQADAALVDSTNAGLYLRRHAEWAAQYDYVTDIHYAIASRISRWETYVAINETLLSMLEDGTVDAILKRWL